MPKLDRNDYISEDEHDSEDINIFEIKVPPLETLLVEFEKEDIICQEYQTKLKDIETSNLNKGFQCPRRYDIIHHKTNQY